MAVEMEHTYAAYALPTPTDTPYRTPSRGLSRRSSRHGSASPAMSSSPPPLPPGGDSYFNGHEGDSGIDDKISPLDPRRFTPTLHANLVSEILSLRREVESKNNLVVSLEESLHTAQSDNANLNNVIASSVQENRTVRKQVEMLEGGTSSAIEVVAKERDEMVDNLAETRKKLEMSQKRLRSQEEDAERTHTMWENDRQKWDVEKRNLDRKIHVVEGRLKTLLSEIEAAQQAHGSMPLGYEAELEDQADEVSYGRGSDSRMSGRGTDSRMSGRGTDSRISVRGHSRVNSNGTRDGESRSVRFSNMSMLKGGMLNGASLADELNFDGEEEEANGEESDQEAGYTSPEALPEEAVHRPRPFSAQSYRESSKARKVLGLSVEGNERPSEEQSRSHSPQHGAKHEDKVVEKDNSSKVLYIDGSTQFSPPSSPILRPQQSSSETTEAAVNECSPALAEVDQPRQPAVAKQTASKQSSHFPIMPEKVAMVSSSCQTAEQPLSPPDTPKTIDKSTFQPETTFEPVKMKIASTQTTEDDMPPQTPPALTRTDTATIMDIPTIAIHPPGTRPSTPQSGVVLPPRTKSASCQASIDLPFSSRSISVQTEEIRVDQRPVKLPAHLLPSAISSNPPSPVPDRSEQRPLAIPPRPTRKPPVIPRIPESPPSEREIRFLDAVSGTTQDAYPGNNDDGPLNNVKESSLRRPIRSGSLFAGFDNAQEGETSAINIADFSDDSAGEKEPIRKTLSKVKNSWKLVPQTQDSVSDRLESSKEHNGTPPLPANSNARPTPHEMGKEQALSKMEQEGKLVKRPTLVTPGKQPDIRRAALISSGTAAHSQRQRSPSAPTIPTSELKSSQAPPPPPAPPFPVPTRASSRKLPISISEGAQSPTPQSTSFFSGGQRKDNNRPAIKKPVLRKIRSAAATTSGQPSRDLPRNRSRSPPLTTSTTSILESPRFPHPPPPLPQSHLTSPILHPTTTTTHHKHHRSRSKPSTPTTTITDGSFPQTSVVDAIAQTMVGEWLWKYVRRRKSFGMPESPAAEFENSRYGADFASTSSVTATSGAAASGGVRHKRWVWLAPYERAVMWSSKQPISGSALLGKSGRKLSIQSVLDIHDPSPPPHPHTPPFNRSILILTPQRALKFTAPSLHRHYVWLTALSFLSHSSLGVADLASLPPPVVLPLSVDEAPPPIPVGRSAGLKREIRDSIRVAKGRPRPAGVGRRAWTEPGVEGGMRDAAGEMGEWAENAEEEAAEAPLVPRVSARTRKGSLVQHRTPPALPSPTITVAAAGAGAGAASAGTPGGGGGLIRGGISGTTISGGRGRVGGGGRSGRGSVSTVASASAETFAARSLGRGLGSWAGVERKRSREGLAAGMGMGMGVGEGNFFDAVGTVRMEAFVGGMGGVGGRGNMAGVGGAGGGEGGVGRQRSSYRTRQGRKKDLSYWGAVGGGGGNGTREEGGVGGGQRRRGEVWEGF